MLVRQLLVRICVLLTWLAITGVPHCAVAQEIKALPAQHAKRMQESLGLFKSQVKGILQSQCFECHGGKSTKGDFDVTSRNSLLESGFVDLEDAAGSHLLAVLRHEAEPHMPFKAPRLPEKKIAAIAQWVESGAAYDRAFRSTKEGAVDTPAVTDEDRQFWSFRPLSEARPPKVDDAWAKTNIDRFLRAAQAEKQLQANPEADRRTLVRRATFDLTGLPPTPTEIQAFLDDRDTNAYEKLIDRLLDSPHYGERWARHWMDVARFAESHGYEQDYDRPHAYHYRDFLIQALNEDLPYNKFLSWQLAGDELAPENPLAMKATGFMGGGVFPTQLTETEFESTRYDELDDIVATTGVAFLGLSVGCARCHDHKFDPIPTKDYYRMAAVFTKTIRSEIELETNAEANRAARTEHLAEIARLEQKIKQWETNDADETFAKWLIGYDVKTNGSVWQQVELTDVTSSGGTKYEIDADGTVLATGAAPDQETITVKFRSLMPRVASLRLEALRHDSLPNGGPGRADNGNFALGDIKLSLVVEKSSQPMELRNPRATHQQNTASLSIAASIDDDLVSGWAVDVGGIGKDQAGLFDLESPVEAVEPQTWRLEMRFHHPNRKHAVGRFRLSLAGLADQPPTIGDSGTPEGVLKALAAIKAKEPVDDKTRQLAREWYLANHSPLMEWKRELVAKKSGGPKLQKSTVQVSSEGFPHTKHHADGRGYPHFYPQTHYLTRGDVQQQGEVAEPGYLQVLMPADRSPANWRVAPPKDWNRTGFDRASLAQWMTDTEFGGGQLAARVAVNRLWQHHFGQGLVRTPNDFGFQGERPTHPQLLDYLARDLIDNNWKLKRVHRLIMTSAAYRQTTTKTAEHVRLDPKNQLWARREPRRLEAEAIRDSVLAVSGQLDRTMYGKGSLDSNMKRRSVYFFIKRSKLIPEMMLFDWPESLVSIGQRATTTTAPQALMFMNSSIVRGAATAQASKLKELSNDQAIRSIYESALGRVPAVAEAEQAEQFLAVQSSAHRDAGVQDPVTLARADLCQVLYGLNEFVFVR
jgi:mono/diheme cytochrome c family protein